MGVIFITFSLFFNSMKWLFLIQMIPKIVIYHVISHQINNPQTSGHLLSSFISM